MNTWALMMSARFPVPSDDQAEASCLIRQIRKLTSAVTTCVLLRQNTNFGWRLEKVFFAENGIKMDFSSWNIAYWNKSRNLSMIYHQNPLVHCFFVTSEREPNKLITTQNLSLFFSWSLQVFQVILIVKDNWLWLLCARFTEMLR